ncbi:hypothetical protein EVAR_82394_1 [Eumeta japonica]|uniref:Uncharacterized protein n=1 Tax=Eumeta variegata TaxID=151549 RepID=A0A4C1UA87_EUMVA|nr:hypothetical protein EVAR_82394_1 [Eumeta japonica]
MATTSRSRRKICVRDTYIGLRSKCKKFHRARVGIRVRRLKLIFARRGNLATYSGSSRRGRGRVVATSPGYYNHARNLTERGGCGAPNAFTLRTQVDTRRTVFQTSPHPLDFGRPSSDILRRFKAGVEMFTSLRDEGHMGVGGGRHLILGPAPSVKY